MGFQGARGPSGVVTGLSGRSKVFSLVLEEAAKHRQQQDLGRPLLGFGRLHLS